MENKLLLICPMILDEAHDGSCTDIYQTLEGECPIPEAMECHGNADGARKKHGCDVGQGKCLDTELLEQYRIRYGRDA